MELQIIPANYEAESIDSYFLLSILCCNDTHWIHVYSTVAFSENERTDRGVAIMLFGVSII